MMPLNCPLIFLQSYYVLLFLLSFLCWVLVACFVMFRTDLFIYFCDLSLLLRFISWFLMCVSKLQQSCSGLFKLCVWSVFHNWLLSSACYFAQYQYSVREDAPDKISETGIRGWLFLTIHKQQYLMFLLWLYFAITNMFQKHIVTEAKEKLMLKVKV